jgi:hypothetical protein
MNYEYTHVSIHDTSPVMQVDAALPHTFRLMNEDGYEWDADPNEWVAIESIERFRKNPLYRNAESLLDGSPGDAEYERGLANIVAGFEGFDGDEVHAALMAYNAGQEA